MLKRFFKSEPGIVLLAWLARSLIRLVSATTRWERVAGPEAEALMFGDSPVIGAIWHNRLMLTPVTWPKPKPVGMVLSEHGDSRILGRALSDYVTRPIYGSTRRNALAALKGMIATLQEGISVGITPDGPRGPRMRCHPGLVQAARASGVPIVPTAWSVRRRTLARSWDRFVIAWPFNTGVIIYGDPIRVAADADRSALEAARRQVEEALVAVTAEADRRMGHAPIEPGREREPRR